ncbi:TetR/AcrR family transcriptional regulator [Paenibacillus sp. SC116]|uniref:TetR/AcrR family transcriptional regulator n=1 Tax=Paenibacillus sp. SC116 TaxID=2968986 RepID=UPI00215B4C11|nr:TetR/AcrR family transcriptional regulator [Paenibacillus sp. SC116]MCR8842322.1 TetR/AcrR family transcriptional regulator [Paenibacillus sp. SC116]
MPPLNEEQLDQLRDERKEQIKYAARKVFACYGLCGTKMSMIASEAGVSQGLSYRYFKSKDELFVELIEEAMEEAMDALIYVSEQQGTPTELLAMITEGMLEENNKYYFMLVQQARTSEYIPEKVQRVLEQYSSEAMLKPLLSIFIQGQQNGEFIEGDPKKLLFWYFAIISGIMLQVQEIDGFGLPDAQFLIRVLIK